MQTPSRRAVRRLTRTAAGLAAALTLALPGLVQLPAGADAGDAGTTPTPTATVADDPGTPPSTDPSEPPAEPTTDPTDPGTPPVDPPVVDPPVIVPSLTAALSKREVAIGKAVRISGQLLPAKKRTLILQRRTDGVWAEVDRGSTSADGTYAFTFKRPAKGVFHYRVIKPATSKAAALKVTLPSLRVVRVFTYVVKYKGTIVASKSEFTTFVAATYADKRGWLRSNVRFRVAAKGTTPNFTVVLAQAKYLPTFSSVCSVKYSCRAGRFVVINQNRWRLGSEFFPGGLTEYRTMVVNHETGHWLGSGHEYCGKPGALAPVMQQQSKGMQGCKTNAFPLKAELEVARR